MPMNEMMEIAEMMSIANPRTLLLHGMQLHQALLRIRGKVGIIPLPIRRFSGMHFHLQRVLLRKMAVGFIPVSPKNDLKASSQLHDWNWGGETNQQISSCRHTETCDSSEIYFSPKDVS